MAKLTIQRQGGLLTNRGYTFKIMIDSLDLGVIKHKQTREIELTNENHRLQVGSSWWKSREIFFDSTSPKIFQVKINPIFNWARGYLLIFMVIYLTRDIISTNTQLFQNKIPLAELLMLLSPIFTNYALFHHVWQEKLFDCDRIK